MKLRFITFVLVVVCAVAGSGCYNTVDGRSQAGVPFVKDKVVSSYIGPMSTVLAAARKVLRTNGQLTSDNSVDNTLEARVENNTVWVKIEETDAVKHVTQVTVEARRKAGGTNSELAHDLDKQIALALNAQ